jgi:hypothetical protein
MTGASLLRDVRVGEVAEEHGAERDKVLTGYPYGIIHTSQHGMILSSLLVSLFLLQAFVIFTHPYFANVIYVSVK